MVKYLKGQTMATITAGTLARDLSVLGVRTGDSVMLHSSLSALGPVQGGADAVIDAFIDAVGPKGTIIFPAFAGNIWKDQPALKDCDYCSHELKLCPSNEPGEQGVIPETFRKRPGTLRSCHPTHSWAAWGPKAQLFLKDHYKSKTPCGRGNPFEALVNEDGCIVCLGVMVNTITMWHYYEDLLDVPYLGYYQAKIRHLSYCTHAHRIQYRFPGIMDNVTKASGIMNIAKVGKGTSRLIRARNFDKFMATIITDDPYCFTVRPPDRTSDDLAIDALQKGAAMLRAWRKGPNRPTEKIAWPKPDLELVRKDCPAFIGYHKADGKDWPLCKANGRHPNLFKAGKIFDENGVCCCYQCSWNLKFPK